VLELVSRVKVEIATVLASACEDAEGLARKVALLEDELVVEHRAWEMLEKEHRAHFEDLTLLQTWGSDLCHAIIGPPWVKHHLSEGMWLAALRHTEMAGELATFRAAVFSTTESMLGRSPSNTAHTKVVGELVIKF
jgi:hypothetical protein